MTESRKDVLRALGVYAVAVLIYLAGTGVDYPYGGAGVFYFNLAVGSAVVWFGLLLAWGMLESFMDSDWMCKPTSHVKRTRLTHEQRLSIWLRDGKRCQHCTWPVPFGACHIDHITPVRKGGSDDPANLRTLCVECHTHRRDDSHNGMVGRDTSRLWSDGDGYASGLGASDVKPGGCGR